MELSYIKKYLRIDFDDDDEVLEGLIESAKAYVLEATGVKYSEKDLTYKSLIKFITAHWYENREIVSDKQFNEMPYSISCLLTHIGIRGELNEQR